MYYIQIQIHICALFASDISKKTEWKESIKFKSEVGEKCIKESVWLVCTLNVNDQNFLSSEPVPKTLDNFRFAVPLHSLSATVSVLTSFLFSPSSYLEIQFALKFTVADDLAIRMNFSIERIGHVVCPFLSPTTYNSWHFLLVQGKNCCIQLRVNWKSITVRYMYVMRINAFFFLVF